MESSHRSQFIVREMSYTQSRIGLLLPSMSRRSDLQAQSGGFTRERQAGRQTEGLRQEERRRAMIYKRGDWYWTDFTENGRRYRRPLKTTNWQEARTEERKVIEKARTGKLADSGVPKRLFEATAIYLDDKRVRCAPRAIELEIERLNMVKKFFGDFRLSAITPAAIQRYQQERKKCGIANRTINMDVGALSRTLKHYGLWRAIEERIKQLPETPSSIGHALTYEEQYRLWEIASSNPDWEPVYLAAIVAANTSLRPVEVKHLQWKNVDLMDCVIRVTRSKLQSGHRVIPVNATARKALAAMRSHAECWDLLQAEHFVWYARQWGRLDPTRPVKEWDTAWRNLR